MRIASYNVMSGGFGYGSTSLVPERLGVLKEAVSILGADLVGLIDTYRWDEVFTNEEIAKMFGYRRAFCINLNDDRLRKIGHNNGITILSNVEEISFAPISLGSRDALRARFQLEEKQLDVYTVYLDDLSEDTRVAQVNRLLEQIVPELPSVVMGDLNALRKEDVVTLQPLIERFFEKNPQLLAGYEEVIEGMRRGEAIRALEQAGFRDGASLVKPTVPTQLFPAKVSEPVLRLDYAFGRGEITIKNFEVGGAKIFDLASDHYPIVFEV